ncbi:PqiB family protein [Methyloterricola oryzae]|uniref:PqiB family protein n=1 Tax=Methyloterricola oryzae TaxID=1495050 RepID=UPI000B2AEFFD|nr:MlaD family protein [Methyloterricola oryzae]
MTDMPEARPPQSGRDRSDASDMTALLVEKSRGLSPVWLIPLVALIIGLWLGYKTLSEEGPTITITFKDAGGLEAGKTKIKYKEVEVGTVETVVLSEDLSEVEVTAKLDRHVESQLGKDTKFWVVEPQLGLGGVSGLDTLIAGHYIAVEFAKGKTARKFVGLEHAPKVSADTPGRHFMLMADNAGSLTDGTPVYFRDILVGRVVGVSLAEDRGHVMADIFVNAPYDRLVHESTRFWQTSGIEASMNSQGFNLKVGSLLSLLGGGISFYTPSLNDPKAVPSERGAQFYLYKDFPSIAEGTHFYRVPFMMHFDDSVRGLSVGAPVELKGIRVGTVTYIKFVFDPEADKLRIPVFLDIDVDRVFSQEQFKKFQEVHKGELAEGRRPVFEKLVERGLRGRLKTGSMLTGQLYVDLDFYPDVPAKTLIYGGEQPEIPTLPSLTEELQATATELMQKLKRIPFDKIGEELLGTVQGSNRLMNSPDLKQAVHSMNLALQEVHQLAQTADREVVKLTTGVEKSLASTAKVLEQLEPGAPMAVDVGNALEELAAAAKSIRALTDYLERHPEALLSGKGGVKK